MLLWKTVSCSGVTRHTLASPQVEKQGNSCQVWQWGFGQPKSFTSFTRGSTTASLLALRCLCAETSEITAETLWLWEGVWESTQHCRLLFTCSLEWSMCQVRASSSLRRRRHVPSGCTVVPATLGLQQRSSQSLQVPAESPCRELPGGHASRQSLLPAFLCLCKQMQNAS